MANPTGRRGGGYGCPQCPQTRATRAGINGHIKRAHGS